MGPFPFSERRVIRRRFNRSLAFWLWSQGGVSTVSLASVPGEICRSAAAAVRHDYDDTALRKELTAGCLIEKGATGTIYFGHRSLQEFLVAEDLMATGFAHLARDDKSASLRLLDLVTPEVGGFISEAAKSSKSTRDLVWGWFDILKGPAQGHAARRDAPVRGIARSFQGRTVASGRSLVPMAAVFCGKPCR
jgi:hypothetical protein